MEDCFAFPTHFSAVCALFVYVRLSRAPDKLPGDANLMAVQARTFYLFIWFSLRGGRTISSARIRGIVEMLDGIWFHVNNFLAEGNQPLLTGRVLMLSSKRRCIAHFRQTLRRLR
jgi:hypothetical protein